jgi:hypothetical protein
MSIELCVAKSKDSVVLAKLMSTARYGTHRYMSSIGSRQYSKWCVGEYKDMDVIIYAKNIVSKVKDLSKVSLILPIKGDAGYSDAYVLGPAFMCLARKSKRGVGRGHLIDKEEGFSGYFSTHVRKLSMGGSFAALFMPDFGGDYHPSELMNLMEIG